MFRKKIRLAVLALAAVLSAFCAASLISGYSFVVLLNDQNPGLFIKNVQVKKGETVAILKDLDLEQGDWTAYLVLGDDDWALLKGYGRNCYRIRDRSALIRLKKAWVMEMTEGDVATVTSYVLFLKNGCLVWEAGVLLADHGPEGFQSSALGWVHPVDERSLKGSFKLFEPVYAPVVIL